MKVLVDLWTDQSGVTTLEYAILLMLVAFSALYGWQGLGETTRSSASRTGEGIGSLAK